MLAPETATSHEAAEIHHGGTSGTLLITCDHACAELPDPWNWSPRDAWLAQTHWASDLGAATLARELADRLACTAVLARFSRLLIDANRDLASPTLFRDVADGRPVELNRELDDASRRARIDRYYSPYHATIDGLVAARPEAALFAVHTFTPEYEGRRRQLEAGVLFTDDDLEARIFATALIDHGYETGLNEPYSGVEGFMYGVERHALVHHRRRLEIEVRQDIAQDPDARRRMLDALEHAIRLTLLPSD